MCVVYHHLTIITCITGVVGGGLALAVECPTGLLTINNVLHDFDKHSRNSIIDGDLGVHIAHVRSVTCFRYYACNYYIGELLVKAVGSMIHSRYTM